MKTVFRIGDHLEIVHHEKNTIIADHKNFRYIKMKDSKYLRFIENNLKDGMTNTELREETLAGKLSWDLMSKMIERLIELEILTKVEWPESGRTEPSNLGQADLFNGRFIHEIEALSFYEIHGISRFHAFERIRNGKVAIVGVGGVGSNVAVMLTAAGIGSIILLMKTM